MITQRPSCWATPAVARGQGGRLPLRSLSGRGRCCCHRRRNICTLQQRSGGQPLPPLVYHENYSYSSWDDSHRFAMSKFERLHSALTGGPDPYPASAFIAPSDPAESVAAVAGGFQGETVARIDEQWLGLAHCPAYVRRFCEGSLSTKEMRRIGLPWSAELVRRTRLEVAGTTLAARLAVEHGLACHLGGGTHHAHRSFGSGFTIFNDMAVAARTLQREGVPPP
jgi:acetoin utilization deacetylase AcuC-like enzyme